MIRYVDRASGEIKEEKVYGGALIELFYNSTFFYRCLLPFIAKVPFFSKLYGLIQKSCLSRRKIAPFIKNYNIDTSEFDNSFSSFNDFFTRKLRPDLRPIAKSDALLPADARYLAYEQIDSSTEFLVKGHTFNLSRLGASEFEGGALLIARLCPVDYHRFHFPVDCVPLSPRSTNGPLFSVSPIALKKKPSILWENKRVSTILKSDQFGDVLFIEVGATYVGSIHQTFFPGREYKKGDEKGYFSFGGSCLLLFFKPGSIIIDQDLIVNTKKGLETFAKMGAQAGISVLS